MFTGLMEIVATGGAHTAVAHITLRTANTRAPAQCPHEIALTASEGNLWRDAVNVVGSTAHVMVQPPGSSEIAQIQSM